MEEGSVSLSSSTLQLGQGGQEKNLSNKSQTACRNLRGGSHKNLSPGVTWNNTSNHGTGGKGGSCFILFKSEREAKLGELSREVLIRTKR